MLSLHAARRTLSLADGPALRAARAFSSQGPLDGATSNSLGTPTPDLPYDDVGSAAVAAAADPGGVLSASMAAIHALHAASGLPWWASIAGLAVGVRAAMLPVALRGIKASAALMPLLRQARKAGDGEQPPSMNATLRRFHELRAAANAPHPAWILGAPLLQLPVFITAMASIRTMSLQKWPGFESGGAAWFPDLTLPALDFASMTAPMGPAGILLPLTIALSMYANIDAAFSVPDGGRSPGSGAAMLWVLGKVRLTLEWVVIPLFAVSLQLPQGALCYWAAGSACALAQNRALRAPAARRALGLPPASGSSSVQPAPPQAGTAQPAATATPAAAAETAAAIPAEAAALLTQAAELQAKGRSGDAAAALRRLLASHPRQPRALFALAQVQSSLKEWADAERCYLEAARLEDDSHQRARAWFGAGVALHMQEEEAAAAEAFGEAAAAAAGEAAATAQLRVRAWVSQATIEVKLGRRDEAVALLRRAAEVEPRVEEVYLKPLLEAAAKERERGEKT